jgi:AbrB family looped-hinge helix DNA binding protein
MIKGLVRHFDDLGRIVVPIEIRNALNIKNQENVEIMQVDNAILIKKIVVDDKMPNLFNKDELEGLKKLCETHNYSNDYDNLIKKCDLMLKGERA